ncbi:MAG TPA: PAS domain-containing sensor histidine kinase [Ramlibacter sp.]
MDISPLAAERELELGGAALKAVVEQAPVAIFVADLEGRYAYVNQAGCRMLGWSREELLGKRIADLLAPADRGRLARSRQAMLQGSTECGEWALRCADGSFLPVEVTANILPGGHWQAFVRDLSQPKAEQRQRQALLERPIAAGEWALARALTRGETCTGDLARIRPFKTIINSATPLRAEDGSIDGAIVVNEDITALHDAQQKQRASEQLFRTVFDLLPVGLWITDKEGRIVSGNTAGRQIWQGNRYVGPEEFDQYKAWWIESGTPIGREEWGVSRAIGQGITSRRELIRIQCFDGSFKTVLNWAAPIRTEAGEITGAVAVNEDVTALHRTQEHLRQAVRDREHLLAVVSHDLRSPLTVVSLTAAVLEQQLAGLPGAEAARASIETLLETTRQMTGLVGDLLAVSAGQGGTVLRLAPVPAAVLLEKAANAARPLFARAGITLTLQVDPGLPAVQADGDRILRVFANLLDNALKFTAAPGQVVVGAQAQSAGVRYCVANTGEPLRPVEMESMFRPFWQLKRDDSRGAGLGLSICRSIVEAHGGTIWAEPAAGHCVRICFFLPAAGAITLHGQAGGQLAPG